MEPLELRVNREDFLQRLELVRPGLSPKAIQEQSDCFVFKGGWLFTFNGEVACRCKSPLGDSFTGAIPGEKLLTNLAKLPDEELSVEITDSRITFRGKGKSWFRREAETTLPVDLVEKPNGWKDLHSDFGEAVSLVQECASKDQVLRAITHVHVHPEWVEACDNYQAARYTLETGFESPTIIRRSALKNVIDLGVTRFSETANWVHFRNPSGLVLSCRRYVAEDFPDLGQFLQAEGEPLTLPTGLKEACDKANDFSSEDKEENQVKVELRPGKLRITGEGNSGGYQEVKGLTYKGPAFTFLIPPELLIQLVDKQNDCRVTKERLYVDVGRFRYMTCLEAVEK